MTHTLLAWIVFCLIPLSSAAQERIYRCGNEYTNTVPDAKAQGCKLLEGGHITIVQGTRAAASAPAPAKSPLPGEASAGLRVDAAEQKARDADARKILDSELKKTELRQLELVREYNQGVPEKRGDESRNPQKYQDRVAELKASLARGEADLSGIRRELARMGSVSASAPTK
jgi:hypothetical protein